MSLKSSICFRRLALILSLCFLGLTVSGIKSANAQLLQWLKRQINGSNGGQTPDQNENGQQQVPTSNAPVVGYNPSYYRPVLDPPNPLTGMNKSFVENQYLLPPDIQTSGYANFRRTDTKKAVSLAQQGEQQIQQGQYLSAEQVLFQAYQYDKANPEVLNDLGVVCDRMNHQSSALTYFKMAATVDTNFAQAFYNAGLDEYSYAGPIPGFPLLVQALRIDGTHADWWYWIGNDKVLNGQYSDGLYYYSQAIKLNSSYVEAYFWRGILELRLSKDAPAHVDLQKARALDPALGPRIATAYNAIMTARREEKALEEAEARADQEAREQAQEAQSYYSSHQRSIQAVVSEGPRYYDAVYNQAVEDGESTEEATEKEDDARDQYNKDVALQSAWESSDYAMMDKINSGEATSDDITYYNSSTSPTAVGGQDSGGEASEGEPQTAAPETDDSGGGD